jgi:alpha-aminoadipic semialdehyde synthase
MNKVVGIRREDKSCWERRTPLTPAHVQELLREIPGLRILVEASKLRIYKDKEYRKAGAEIVEDLD